MVPRAGIEPAHPCGYKILSLARLPVPPPGHCKHQVATTGLAVKLEFAGKVAIVAG